MTARRFRRRPGSPSTRAASIRGVRVGFAALAVIFAASCAPEAARDVGSSAPVPVASAKQAVAGAALVIDVRSPDEFSAGHLDRAKNIPVDDVTARADEIAAELGGDRTKPVVVYCASGKRSAKAKEALERAGFTQVTNAGGYDDLKG